MPKKNRVHAKDMREKNKAEDKAKWAQKAAAKVTVEAKKETADTPEQTTGVQPKAIDGKKSKLKALGIKSTFTSDDQLIITSFGRGSEAVIETKIKDKTVDMINENSGFYFNPNKEKDKILVERMAGRKGAKDSKDINDINDSNGVNENPDEKEKHFAERPVKRLDPESPDNGPLSGVDCIRCKSKLEKIYFGQKFDNENIHIQLIYNILDIEKILAVYSNSIGYSICSLNRGKAASNGKMLDEQDVIGYMGTKYPYGQFNNPNNPAVNEAYNGILDSKRSDYFFGGAFDDLTYEFDKNKKGKKQSKEEYDRLNESKRERIHYVISLMGALRQGVTHGDQTKNLYNLGSLREEFKKVLNAVYHLKVDDINKNFSKNNQNNLKIVKKALEATNNPIDDNALSREFFKFKILKDYKYLGVSVKKLRERMLEMTGEEGLASEKYISVRQKINTLIDFLIYHSYTYSEGDILNKLVEDLRSKTEDEEKEALYKKEAERLWNGFSSIVLTLSDDMLKENYFKELESEGKIKADVSDLGFMRELAANENADYFCKLVYLMTIFLDGKEINDLVTTLINKFDNIASFIDTLRSLGLDCSFEAEYSMFEHSTEISVMLREINSFALMREIKPSKIMYEDALRLFGAFENHKIDDIQDFIHNAVLNEDKLKSGKKLSPADKKLANFIANNIIKSNRFKYIVKYANTEDVRAFTSCKPIVKLVLERHIDPKQVDRYYNLCCADPKKNASLKDKCGYLTTEITGVNKGLIRNLKEFNEVGKSFTSQTQKTRNMLGLYLMVAYQIVKNLINVNSRYVIAVHCLERDMGFHGIENKKAYYALTDKFVENGYLRPRRRRKKKGGVREIYLSDRFENIIKDNRSKAIPYLFVGYRNIIAHLAVITNSTKYINKENFNNAQFNSFFELYHYIMQLKLEKESFDSIAENRRTGAAYEANKEFFQNVRTYKKYSKDLLWVLNTPFAYNLSRYKILSINNLFDKNFKPEGEKNQENLTCETA